MRREACSLGVWNGRAHSKLTKDTTHVTMFIHRHVTVHNVPAIGVVDELLLILRKHGDIEQYASSSSTSPVVLSLRLSWSNILITRCSHLVDRHRVLDNVPCAPHSVVVLVSFASNVASRFARRKCHRSLFFGQVSLLVAQSSVLLNCRLQCPCP